MYHLNTGKKPALRQLSSTKIQKAALCCFLFHKLFPYSLPFCGFDWLGYKVCQWTRKAKWELCTKTLPCSVVSARPDTPCSDPQSLLFSECVITPMGVVALWQDFRSGCKFVNAMSHHISYPHPPAKAAPPPEMMLCFKSTLIPVNCLHFLSVS